jgi:biopolymer transport protein ExbD
MASNCISCHSTAHQTEPRPEFLLEKYLSSIKAKSEPRAVLAVSIDPTGIRIAGNDVAPEPKALEERFRAARDAEGHTKVVLSASNDTPFWTVKMLTEAAQRVGFQDISFAPLEDLSDRKGKR